MTDPTRKHRTPRANIVFAFALAIAGYLAWILRIELIILYVSALFAVVLTPVVQAVERWQFGRWRPKKPAAVIFMLIAIAAFLAGFGYLAVPPVVHDLEQLSTQSPALPQLIGKLHRIPLLDRMDFNQLSERLQGVASETATGILHSAKDVATRLTDIATGIILTVYFILEGDVAYRWFLTLIPLRSRDRLDQTLRRSAIRMEKWLLGQLSLMLILGACSTAVYALLHIRYAYALGVLTGLLNIIPVLGAAISIVLVLFIAAIDSWTKVIGVAVFYLVYMQVENSYLTPRIMRSRVNLPGLAIIVALLFGFGLAGVEGALVAVPTAVLVAELVEEYLVWKDLPFAGPV
jgi:predicted PurR-regulated permease PerM